MKIPKVVFPGVLVALAALFSFGLGVIFQMYIHHDALMDSHPADSHVAGNGNLVVATAVDGNGHGNNLRVNLKSGEELISLPVVSSPPADPDAFATKEKEIASTSPPALSAPSHDSPFVKRFYRDMITFVPPLVQAWRQAKVDWHQLLPKHDSSWERFGKNQKGLRVLVSKEEQLADYLTMFHESGLASKYGIDHGPLAPYMGCNILSDSCMVHNHKECLENQLCSWDTTRQLCADFDPSIPSDGRAAAETCSSPYTIRPGSSSIVRANVGDCKRWVTQPAGVLSFDSEAQSMFYHWLAAWSSMLQVWSSSMKSSRHSHFLLSDINDPMLFQFFGTLSDYCWRRTNSQVPPGTCFCHLQSHSLSQSRASPEQVTKSITEFFQVQSVKPPATHVKIGIISRRVKRFVLNEYELVDIAQEMGYECVLLPLERMTIYEQMREFRSLDVLVGMHGSGLDNVIFLHPGSVLLQLMPFKNEHRASFVSSAERARVVYKEWKATDSAKSFFHWDLFEQANKEKLERMGKDRILNGGSQMGDHRETLMFWINQDIIVPPDEWRRALADSVRASNARKRGLMVD